MLQWLLNTAIIRQVAHLYVPIKEGTTLELDEKLLLYDTKKKSLLDYYYYYII